MTSPAEVKRLYEQRLTNEVQLHRDLMHAVYKKTNQAGLETTLVEQFVLSVAALWEAFISDLMIAYVAQRPRRALDDIRQKVSQSLEAKFGAEVARSAVFKYSKEVTKARAAALLDHRGWNLNVATAEQLSSRANSYFTAKVAKRFSMSAEDGTFIEHMTALRNFLAHRSAASRERLRTAHNSLAGEANANLRGRLLPIGPYLKAEVDGQETRALVIATKLLGITRQL